MKVNKTLVLALAVIILSATAIGSASTTNNSAIGGLDSNKYSLTNLSHLKSADFRAYVEVKHTNPLSDQVKTLRDQGLDNASIEKTFADNGITYNSTSGAFVLASGYTPTPEELKNYITPTYPFKDVSTASLGVNSLMTTTSNDTPQSNVVLETLYDTYQGIKMRTSHGSLSTTIFDPQRVYTMHMGYNGCWTEEGVVASQLNGPRSVDFFVFNGGSGWGDGWHFWPASTGIGDLSPSGINEYKIFLWIEPSGMIWTCNEVNGNLIYMKPYFPFTYLDCNVANEIWSYVDIWDAVDPVPSISQNMYIYCYTGTLFDNPNGWQPWSPLSFLIYYHWHPITDNPLGNQLSISEGTYWLRTGMHIP